MATAKRQLRRLVVGRVEYRWRATYQWIYGSTGYINDEPFRSQVSVFRELPHGRAGFIVSFGPDDRRSVVEGAPPGLVRRGVPITPGLVREAIGFALSHGWDPRTPGPFRDVEGLAETTPGPGAR